MKRFRFRLSSLLWLVAVAAAVLWGIRYHYQQDREVPVSLEENNRHRVVPR